LLQWSRINCPYSALSRIPNDICSHGPVNPHRRLGGTYKVDRICPFHHLVVSVGLLPSGSLDLECRRVACIVGCTWLCRGHNHPYHFRGRCTRGRYIHREAEINEYGSPQSNLNFHWVFPNMDRLVLFQWWFSTRIQYTDFNNSLEHADGRLDRGRLPNAHRLRTLQEVQSNRLHEWHPVRPGFHHARFRIRQHPCNDHPTDCVF